MTPRSPDEAALLTSVWAAPHDDLPRLVYADWLEEHGDAARAEFIRLQCGIAARELRGDDPPAGSYDREREIIARHGRMWRIGWPAARRGTGFDRGFPVRTTPDSVSARGFSERDESRRPAPLLEVSLHSCSPDAVAAFLACPLAPWVGRLQLGYGEDWGRGHTDALLAGQDRLVSATDLGVVSRADPAAATRLCGGLRLPRLARFRQPPTPGAEAETLDALAGSGLADQMSDVDLPGPAAARFARLGTGGRFPRLLALHFRGGDEQLANTDVVAALVSPAAARVRTVTISGALRRGRRGGEPADRVAHDLAAAPLARRLRRVEFHACQLTDGAMRALAAAPGLEDLVELAITGLNPPVPTAGLAALRARFGPRLRDYTDYGWYDRVLAPPPHPDDAGVPF